MAGNIRATLWYMAKRGSAVKERERITAALKIKINNIIIQPAGLLRDARPGVSDVWRQCLREHFRATKAGSGAQTSEPALSMWDGKADVVRLFPSPRWPRASWVAVAPIAHSIRAVCQDLSPIQDNSPGLPRRFGFGGASVWVGATGTVPVLSSCLRIIGVEA
jgi:hypothetical protein